jgi:hypothetical protein
MVDDRIGDPKEADAADPHFATDGSSVTQSGWKLGPLALICQPLIVMLLLVSTSIAPVRCLLIVPAPVSPIPAPFGFSPSPSRVT